MMVSWQIRSLTEHVSCYPDESRCSDQVAKGAKEDELKKSKDEKASKENTLEECKAKIEHFTSVIAQAEVDIKDAKESQASC